MSFFLDPGFEHDHLVFEELFEELHKFDEAELSRFILRQEVVHALVLRFETRIYLSIKLISSHAASGELFNHLYIDGAVVISIATIIQNSAHVEKLVVVDQDVGEILDSFFVVDGNFFFLTLGVLINMFLALVHL